MLICALHKKVHKAIFMHFQKRLNYGVFRPKK